MPKATITVCDTADGKLDVHIEFEPPASNSLESAAHATALRFIEMLKREDDDGDQQ